MSVYMIVEAKEVTDKNKYSEYIQKVPQTIAKFGGKYLARGGKVLTVAGDWNPPRLIIVKFASMDNFQSWWNSSEYKLVAPLREQSAKTNAIVVEGL
ncbi:MAG: DUF1330 domain-containing protein [Candidatus Omnitrophota bacterium]